jgi:hypothetical protein
VKRRDQQIRLLAVLYVLALLCLCGGQSSSQALSAKQKAAALPTEICFTADPPPFSDDWLKPPTSAAVTYLDPVEDQEAITRNRRFLREELTRYPAALLKQDLKEVYVFKHLSEEDTEVGGLNSPEDKKLYLTDDGIYSEGSERFLRLSLHHEMAHLLFTNHASQFSAKAWAHLNPASFRYGNGGLESIRTHPNEEVELNPESWEEGFGYEYGKSDIEEDFACLAEAIFSGNPDFWKAVDRVPALKKKVNMLVAFYHSLDKSFDEAYFRHLPPVSGTVAASAGYYGSGRHFAAVLLLGIFLGGGLLLILSLVLFAWINSRQPRKKP